MDSKKVIILNGAPSTGKDTIAFSLQEALHFEKKEVKQELFKIALSISGISDEEWFDRYDNRSHNLKEASWDKLGGLSQREFMIKISEDWMKPVFGNDIFGIKAAESVLNSDEEIFIFSDGGFKEELDAMSRLLGEDNVLLIRLHRDGCSFKNDSRTHLDHKHAYDVHNNGSVRGVCQEIYGIFINSIL